MAHTLPDLPYAYEALEPVIGADTMHLHHDKHHQTYLNNLNAALEKHPEIADAPVESLLSDLANVPEDIRKAVQNSGGGYYNHNLFWEEMTSTGTGGEPTGALAEAITSTFGSFDEFKAKYEAAGVGHFGSGWVWLILNKEGKLEVTSLPNQDTPLALGATPLLCNDLWEHAYYLDYQNRRADYLKAWWDVVNWKVVEERFLAGE